MDNVSCPSCGLENLEDYEETYVDDPVCPECGFDLTEYFETYSGD